MHINEQSKIHSQLWSIDPVNNPILAKIPLNWLITKHGKNFKKLNWISKC